MVGGDTIHGPELPSAASRQQIIIWLSTGLLKNPAAPAASARWRIPEHGALAPGGANGAGSRQQSA